MMEMHPHARFLIVIPAYREAARLPSFLAELLTLLKDRQPEARVVICDDGSGLGHQQQLRERLAMITSPVLLPTLYREQNEGKGGAILAAWDQYPGFEGYGFVDADGAVPAREVVRLLERSAAEGITRTLLGSRIRMLGRRVERSPIRHAMGRVFNSLVAALIEPGVYDSQCGFKLLPAPALQAIRPWLKGRRFAFDVELIAAHRVLKLPMREVPIDWNHVHGSKVNFLRDIVRMFRSVLEIRREMEAWSQSASSQPASAARPTTPTR